MKLGKMKALLLLVCLTLFAYANTFKNSFVWDDDFLVVDNSYIRNSEYIDTVFLTDLFHDYTVGVATHYRPLQTLSLMFDYAIWGLNPCGYHVTNVLLHLFCVLLVWLVLEKLSGNRTLAVVVALLFAVHPVNTNAVAYVAGRADPIAFAAMLASLWLYLGYRESSDRCSVAAVVRLASSVFCFVAALFSRESALLFPTLICVYCLTIGTRGHGRWREAASAVWPFVFVAAAFYFWRVSVLEFQGKPVHLSWSMPVLLRVQVFLRSIATYGGLLFWPAHLQMERQVIVGGPTLHLLTLLGGFSLIGFGVLTRWLYRNCKLAFFGLCWFAVALLPLCGVLNLNSTVAEHWLYVPSMGAYLAIAATYFRFKDQLTRRFGESFPRVATTALTLALAALTLRTIRRNADWESPSTLYAATKQVAPYSANVRCNLGLRYLDTGKIEEARVELQAAERIEPSFAPAKVNFAAYYFAKDDLDKAQMKAEEAVRLDPKSVPALLLLAQIWDRCGDFQMAHRYYLRATASTCDVGPLEQYGKFLREHGRFKEVLRVVDEAYRADPSKASVFNLLGATLADMGFHDKAREAFEVARSLDRHSEQADMNLARLSTLQGDLAGAELHYRRALKIAPSSYVAHYQLGVIYWKRGQFDAAATELESALTLSPNSVVIRDAIHRLGKGERYA